MHQRRKTNASSLNSDNLAPNKLTERGEEQSVCRRFASHCFSVLKWLVIVAIVPPLMNYASLKAEERALQPDGAVMYNVNYGQTLMLRCLGTGLPTVIFDNPTGMTSDIWLKLWKLTSKTTRSCVYDRGGIGYSERPPSTNLTASSFDSNSNADGNPAANPNHFGHPSEAYTVERMSDDFKRLFTEASSSQAQQPFILVGSELGALVARFYSHMFDNTVYHVILVDPLSSSLFTNADWSEYWRGIVTRLQSQQLLSALGLYRLSLLTGVSDIHPQWYKLATHDSNITRRQLHHSCHPKHLKSSLDEHWHLPQSFQQIKILGRIKPVPSSIHYTVLYRNTFDRNAEQSVNKVWRESEQTLFDDLQLPAKQVSMIKSPATSVYSSLAGKHSKQLLDIITAKVAQYRSSSSDRVQSI